MPKTFATDARDALALAVAAATQNVDRMSSRKSPASHACSREGVQQLNIRIDADAHRKLKAVAFAWDTTVRDLLESFIAQLPDVPRENVAAPAAVAWAKRRR
jgi:uncharacterized protein (DUF4415 family)